MSKPILVKFDNSLPDEDVTKVLAPTSAEEGGAADNDISEVKVTGVFTPLIKINNKVIPWAEVMSFKLSSTGFLPECSFSFMDSDNKVVLMDTPGPDNYVIIEVIPPFDNIYKKIKLKFYITDIHTNVLDKLTYVDCVYSCEKLNDCNIESFGKITTYKFYEEVAQRLKLGLCSNLDDSGDERYIYMDSMTFRDSLEQEINLGGNSTCILDSWIDWWNNINIVDLYDLYSGDPDPDLKVWVCSSTVNVDAKDKEEVPYEIPAIITNHIKMRTSPLFAGDFKMEGNNSKNVRYGTDRAINTYDTSKQINKSMLLQDGSGVKTNIYTKFYYRGEFNGDENDGNYLMQPEIINIYKQKIDNNKISVTLFSPCLGLMRGGKVNLEWYDDSNFNEDIYSQSEGVESNIDVDADAIEMDNPNDMSLTTSMILNKKISGQYFITGTTIQYDRFDVAAGPSSSFVQTFELSRKVESFNYTDILE